ncbi:hypothetical protein [Leptolyngbya sp. NIES-2104]|uniref:hypothetical protein n=1 Tax=Leptolyngbya sp. NIES-2104 TaxID=1552121 RepID=UPI0006EC9030|nr:hypothetical protein [Leptolyngbya sp. NIES-2104]GAP96114.1 hypothetical protein NIES2104_26490 [Leptolyngbya sp. NIES-2104]
MPKNCGLQAWKSRTNSNRRENDSQVFELVDREQLDLLANFQPERTPDLILEPVPDRFSLADDRFYIHYNDWYAPIQLTRSQAYRAIELCGSSRDSDTIWQAIERTVNGGVR